MKKKSGIMGVFNLLVIVAALGYFVDIYDLVLFSIVRVESLKDLGLTGQALMDKGVLLLNMQMIGMLIGGIFWGILGDKRGRLSVLFGSILLYSIANIANGFVHTVETYALWRFIAGIGLAGELGAGITLVSESLSKESRGYATMWIATVGVSGAVFAGVIAEFFTWRTNFIIGGVLGLCLLLLRVSVVESGLYQKVSEQAVTSRGNFLSLFTQKTRFFRYLMCILIGVPLWYVVGILITFSPEISHALGVVGTVAAGKAVMFCYLGLVFGDFASGWLSQLWKSRKKAVLVFLIFTLVAVICNFMARGISSGWYYALCGVLGFSSGYWAVFVTVGAEQFGTNLRSTVAITVPNFVRGAVVPLTLSFQLLKPMVGIIYSAAILGFICLGIAFTSLYFLRETYGKDLDFIESV